MQLRMHVLHDVGFVAMSVVLALILARIEGVEYLLATSKNIGLWGSFIAGLFFTSVFTTAPAIVVLGEIAQMTPVPLVALLGGLGAVIGDLVIFHIFRDHIADDVRAMMHSRRHRFKLLVSMRAFRWIGLLIGALVIASPLPDELGIALMGFARLDTKVFVPISFLMNFIGILAIGVVSRSL